MRAIKSIERAKKDQIFLRPVLLRPSIFPNLCFGVSSLDLGLEAENTASTALAAAGGIDS